MKIMLIVASILMLLIPSVFARKKPDRAGKVSDYVFTDKKHDFKFKLNEGWKAKIKNNDQNCRLTFTQSDFAVPPDYQSAPDYTKIPRVAIYVTESKMSISNFIDSLVSVKYESDQKKDIMKEFEILNPGTVSGYAFEKLVPRKRNNIEIAGLKAKSWTGQLKYTAEVQTSASSLGGKRVQGAYGGLIIGIKKDDKIILFHAIAEWMYFNPIVEEVTQMAKTLEW